MVIISWDCSACESQGKFDVNYCNEGLPHKETKDGVSAEDFRILREFVGKLKEKIDALNNPDTLSLTEVLRLVENVRIGDNVYSSQEIRNLVSVMESMAKEMS